MPKLDLDARLKKSLTAHAAPAPDLHPRKKEKEVEEEVLPDLQEVVTSSADRLKIIRLVNECVGWQTQEAQAKRMRAPLTEQLKKLIGEKAGADKFMVDGNRVAQYTSTRNTLNKNKLMLAGVSLPTILACTDTSTSMSLKITPPGNGVEDAE